MLQTYLSNPQSESWIPMVLIKLDIITQWQISVVLYWLLYGVVNCIWLWIFFCRHWVLLTLKFYIIFLNFIFLSFFICNIIYILCMCFLQDLSNLTVIAFYKICQTLLFKNFSICQVDMTAKKKRYTRRYNDFTFFHYVQHCYDYTIEGPSR